MKVALDIGFKSFLAAIAVAVVSVGMAEVSPAEAANCPNNYSRYRNSHRAFTCYCPAYRTTRGRVWGSGVYTDDSSICRAARHAGAVSSRGGNVSVRGARGRTGYRGSYRNGVGSANYGRWHWSFTVAGRGGGGGGGGNAARICRNYAQNAVNQNRQNLRRRCGNSGGRWQSNYRAHYNWCLRANNNWRRRETNARSIALRRCRGAGGNAARICRNYAQNAVNQNRQNLRRRCGYGGGRWQSNYRAHYNWCLRANNNWRQRETNARNIGLRRCRGNRGLFKSRWDKIGGPGGGWSTGWVRNQRQRICGHRARGCSCFG
ncbi:MAG: LCCL domain-containing protein, partial [Alphaproteobacteria bacterium]